MPITKTNTMSMKYILLAFISLALSGCRSGSALYACLQEKLLEPLKAIFCYFYMFCETPFEFPPLWISLVICAIALLGGYMNDFLFKSFSKLILLCKRIITTKIRK